MFWILLSVIKQLFYIENILELAVKLSKKLMEDAKIASKLFDRSVSQQIEHWAKIGKIAEDNPDLPYEFIKSILIARQELRADSR